MSIGCHRVYALILLGGIANAACMAAGPPFIAALVPGPPDCPVADTPSTAAYQHALEQAGLGAARQVQYCFLTSSDLPSRVQRILAEQPDVILVWGSPTAARALREATTRVPIVFVDVSDPIENGLVTSLAHPGGNATGITNITEELVVKRVEILKEALPNMQRLALLANLGNPEQQRFVRVIELACRVLQIEYHVYSVESQTELATAFAAMRKDQMQAVLLLPDVWFYPIRSEIIELASRFRIPAMYGNSGFADLGGLFVYGANLSDMSQRSVSFVAKILQGAKPGDLPVERPTSFDFVVNARTAREQGVQVSPAAMLRATKVVD